MLFRNGSQIKGVQSNKSVRGIRSNFITTLCLDLDTGDWIIKTIDMREPLDRFIPIWVVDEIIAE